MMRLLRPSLKLRVVSAGGCNGCEVDVNVLGTLAWDLGRFGIQFVASPRHADGLVLCGPVTANMALALRKTYDAVPAPKIVIAVGACAISGGPYLHQEEQLGGARGRAARWICSSPAARPIPLTILDGLLRLLGRLCDHVPWSLLAAHPDHVPALTLAAPSSAKHHRLRPGRALLPPGHGPGAGQPVHGLRPGGRACAAWADRRPALLGRGSCSPTRPTTRP